MSFLKNMLDALTTAYNTEQDSNIGRLLSLYADSMERVKGGLERVDAWRDVREAQGITLDHIGANFGVQRNGTDDAFYRLMIIVKMRAMLSGGDIDTVIQAVAELFGISTDVVDLRELYPAKTWIYLDEALLAADKIDMAEIIASMVKRITAAGIGTRLVFRTYQDHQNEVQLNNACAETAEITLRSVERRQSYQDTAQLTTTFAETAMITIRPVNIDRLYGTKQMVITIVCQYIEITIKPIYVQE